MVTATEPAAIKENRESYQETVQVNIFEGLPEAFKRVVTENAHLLEYLKQLPIAEIGMPEYCPELTRKMGDNKKPNLIYPAHKNGVFVHILFNKNRERNFYIPIEPTLNMDHKIIMQSLETKILELGRKLKKLDVDGDREKQMLALVDRVTTVTDQPKISLFNKYLGFLSKDAGIVRLKVTQRELEALRYLFVRDKLGLGILDPLIVDPYIEDISCSGTGNVFVEHKIFKSLSSAVIFSTNDELDSFVQWLSERVKKPVSYKNPISDATLPDGSRINIVFGNEVSKRGSNFSIRKFNEIPLSIFEVLDFGTLNYEILAYLSLVIGNGMNVFVSGETASGKTTLMNAVTTFIPPLAKIITIEDTPELQVPHKNWLREVVQTNKTEGEASGVTIFDLLKAALRQRPNEIMIGEIRGREGNVAFQAMQTGHSVMATFHAASVEKLIQRITGDPILVPKNYVDNLNVVILTSQVKLPNGKLGRRITGISEIVGYDSALESFSFIESFKWNQETDGFEFTGYMTSYILENKIAPKLGIPSHKKQQIYAEMDRRAKILMKLHKEMGISGFYEVLDVLNKAQNDKLF
ncbi:MAG: type II/IV secretion system ATPase subunit [Terracidiphilus sp.]